MDLKNLGRIPAVLAMAILMVLVISSAALAAPSEKGEENGRGNDNKEAAEQEEASEEADDESSERQGSQQEGSTASSPPDDDGDPCTTTHGSDSGNGANTDGPNNSYTSNCDGRASDNGNDSGGGGGRPCAGCVGNADDKNPPGQATDDSDANSGYECDTNNGVGGKKSNPGPAGNPAHTGCRVPPTNVCTVNCGPPPACPPGSTAAECLPPTCPDGSVMPANGKCNNPPKLCPDGTPMPPDGTCVRGIIIEKDKNPGVPDIVKNIRVQPAPDEPQPQVAAGAVLPFTGGDLLPLITLALVLMTVGALSLRRPAGAGAQGAVEGGAENASGVTVQLPSGKTFTLPLRRAL